MIRYVFKVKGENKFYKDNDNLVDSPIDGLLFENEFIASVLVNVRDDLQLCVVDFSVNSCEPVVK